MIPRLHEIKDLNYDEIGTFTVDQLLASPVDSCSLHPELNEDGDVLTKASSINSPPEQMLKKIN